MKKTVATLLSLLLVLAFSTTGMAYTVSDVNVLPVVDEPVTYTAIAPDVTYIEALNESTLTQWMFEKTNVKIEWEEIPDSEFKTKLNLLIAAEELPDTIIYGSFSLADLANYGAQGLFIPLEDLYEEHGYNIKKIFDAVDGLPGGYTSLDGHIYTLPDINECYHCFHSLRAWINNEWLTNLGLEYPETLDDLVNVLTAFQEQDANGNGIMDDEIPFTGCSNSWNAKIYPFLLNSFLYFDETYLSVQDGNVVFAPTQPEFKEGITFIADLIQKGLIEKEGLTQTEEQLKVKGSNPESVDLGVVMGATYWIGFPAGSPGEADQRSREYLPLSPLEGPNGVRISPTTGIGYNVGHTVITSLCEDPVPLVKLFDFMLSDEATLRANMGVEGEDYELPPEGELGINGKPALYKRIEKPEGSKNFNSMPNLWPSNRTSDFRLGEWADASDPDTQWKTEPRLYTSTHDYFVPYGVDYRLPSLNMTAEEAERHAFLKEAVDSYTREQIVRFLAGERSLDEWDAFVDEYASSLDLDEYLELIQTAYTRQYGS